MAKELRLAFAMGGGVSLGTFSGASLSEAVKLAVLHAGYLADEGDPRSWTPYDRVVIDVFSGASAGALSLAVMLRSLLYATPEQRRRATDRLKADPVVGDFAALPAAKRDDLIAAQVLQDSQVDIWRDEIHLQGLLGNGPAEAAVSPLRRDLTHIPAIFDRREIERIARKFLSFPEEARVAGGGGRAAKVIGFSGRRLLGDRVLYACTISNLTAIPADATGEFLRKGKEIGLRALADGAISNVHRELRVFDMTFRRRQAAELADEERSPTRWCRYHDAPEKAGSIGDLGLTKTWSKVAATAIASGSFPFAFEPVVLMRKSWEFSRAMWPAPLRDAGVTEYPFSYVDGGTFNNEPIREAFRMSAFKDATDDPASFDRRVVYVDPFVDAKEPTHRVKLHQEYSFQDPRSLFGLDLGPIDGFDLIRRATMDRLIPYGGSVVAAIMNEARVVEGDKVGTMTDRFEMRDVLRAALDAPLGAKPTRAGINRLRKFCNDYLEEAGEDEMVPPRALDLADDLRRVIRETGLALDPAQAGAFLKRTDPEADAQADLWQRALAFVAVDLAMDMGGKSSVGRLIAVAPIRNPLDRNASPEPLPGGRLHGFGGFTSIHNRNYEVKLARFCTYQVFKAAGVIPAKVRPPEDPVFTKDERIAYESDLKIGVQALATRVSKMVKQSHLLEIFPGLDGLVLKLVGGYLEKKIKQMAEESRELIPFELRVRVPDGSFELDGSGIGSDTKPVRIPDGSANFFLLTYADYDPLTDRWSGPSIDISRQLLPIDVNMALNTFCRVRLPDVSGGKWRAADRNPNPRFDCAITKGDKGKELPASRWTGPHPGVDPLDDTLLT